MRALALLFAIGLTIHDAPAVAQTAAASEAEQVERYLQSQMRALRIPGLQVAVVRGGRIVLLRSYGIASVELQVPVTDPTVLAINSITKAFTGVVSVG